MFSITIIQLWLVMMSTSHVLSQFVHYPPAEKTLERFLKEPQHNSIVIADQCLQPSYNDNPLCSFDISVFNQEQTNQLFGKRLRSLTPWLVCDKSNLSVLDFSNLTRLGHLNIDEGNYHNPLEGNNEAFKITNNLNLRKIDLGNKLIPCGSFIRPGFFMIMNNPRLSRLSIDGINSIIKSTRSPLDICKLKPMVEDKIKMQKYGECDYLSTTTYKKTLTWEEFRWCRTIKHDVVLTGDQFKPNLDTAYILHVEGTLTLTNTAITDLSMLPVYFKINRGEISGNKLLCIGFEDEIRMKRLGFTMKENMDLSCRTECKGGTLSLEDVKSLKNCVTLTDGLELDGIDDVTAAADLFKTVRTINGPVVIKNAKATVDFKELKEIINTQVGPHITLEACKDPILFRKLTKLEGTEASPIVVLKNARIDILQFLEKTYPDKIVGGSKKATTESVITDRFIFLSSTEQPKIVTGTRASRVGVPPTNTPVVQREDRKLHDDKPSTTTGPAVVAEVITKDRSASANEEDFANSPTNSPTNSPGDPGNSAVDGKKTSMFMVLTIVSVVIYLASSVTSVLIVLKYNVM